MNPDPMVSVLMLTYNHENFIGQAIESVLAQKTSFEFELIIGEDCSTDRTKLICKQYKDRFPGKIQLLTSDNNLGLGRNFMRTFNTCKGKYIAICEGDDFWIHQNKLQIQVDFLEKNQEYSICCHRVMNYYMEDKSKSLSNFLQQKFSNIIDLSRKNFIANVSCVYRNNLFQLPEWFANISTYDYAMHMLNAQFGKIAYFPKVMAVYRQHNSAIWSEAPINNKLQISMDVRKLLIDYFKDKPQITKGLKEAYADIAYGKIKNCSINGDKEELEATWSNLLNVNPDWVLEKIISCKINESFYKLTIKKILKIITFIRKNLSKLYPLPQLKLKN